MTTCTLKEKTCKPCSGETPALTNDEITVLLPKLDNWHITDDNKVIHKEYKFKGFYKTMAFVNAIAWVANQQGHHPDLEIGYNYCNIKFTTHAIDGLSENDFICAAKVDELEG